MNPDTDKSAPPHHRASDAPTEKEKGAHSSEPKPGSDGLPQETPFRSLAVSTESATDGPLPWPGSTDSVPKMPHEMDQSPESQSSPDRPGAEITHQAFEDIERGLVDTDRNLEGDRAMGNRTGGSEETPSGE